MDIMGDCVVRHSNLYSAHSWKRRHWVKENGPVPSGMWLLHACGNGYCTNLSHIYIGSPADNCRDTVEHGHHRMAQRTHCPKGHSLDGVRKSKTTRSGTTRYCRTCNKERTAAWHSKKRTKAA